MTPQHRLAIEIMSECGLSRVAIVKDSGWYLEEAPSMNAVKGVLAKRRNQARALTLNGETKTVIQWEKKTGIKRKTIYERLRLGWSVLRTLNTPSREYRYAQ